MNRSEAIKNLLINRTHPDLAAMYNAHMEVQVNVAQDGGERIDGDYKGRIWHGWTDGLTTWKSFRIPHNAKTEPEANDYDIKFDLAMHAEGIGMTGWDWHDKVSRWVAFDFDAITGHSDKHQKKLGDAELKRIQEVVSNIPWITVRASTGGKGLHLYVMLDPPVKTENHTEHAAVARAILGMLASMTGFDFQSKVDQCVTADTWTTTYDGPKQVRELINKPFVAMVRGFPYNATGFWSTGEKEVFELETEDGYCVQATANHPFLRRLAFGHSDRRYEEANVVEHWVQLDSLSVGDSIYLCPQPQLEWEGTGGSWEDGYILGHLFGDGYFANRGAKYHQLLFFPNDYYLSDYVAKLIGPSARVSQAADHRIISAPRLEELRVQYGLDTSKVINEHIESASSDFLCGFVSGMFDTDGHARCADTSVILSQSDLTRLRSIQRILLRLGIKSTIREEREAGPAVICGRRAIQKIKYTLTIYKENVNVFNARVGFKHPDKLAKNREQIEKATSGTKSRLATERFFTKIKSITSVGIKTVYDVTVDSVHAFDANGLLAKNCGGNMWVWHRKMLTNPNGLKLIQQGSALHDVPGNWREHVDVISSRNRKTVPSFITDQGQADEIQRLFDEVTGQKSRTPLDDEHQRLIKFLHEIGAQSYWNQDHHMLITHTKYLLRAHTELGLKGIFKTNSPGTEDEQNCYCFPLRGGAWVVRRYTPGVAEESTWDQDGNGWTRCWFNQVPTLPIASRSMGGIEHKAGGYVFREAEIANKTLESLGVFTKLPTWLSTRRAKLKEHRDGKRMLFEITHDPNDRADEMQGWLAEKGVWTRIFNLPHANIAEPEIGNYDDLVRHLITETGEDYGWLLKSDRQWRVEPLVHVRTFLKSLNLKQLEADTILGSAIAKPWRMVCRPFQPEILGDRDWNRNAPQLAHVPTQTDNLSYPTWLKVLNHCGKGLDDAVKNNPWAKANGILTGADYLKCWISSLFKEPMEPLPYLFFYGPQNSGKSIFHESLGLLVTCGVTRADNAITNQQGFNGELENAILCVIEETDLGRDKKANERIKDWVTSRNLPLHRKGATQYTVINYTHWVQCGNGAHMCAIFPGDTRITMIFVDSLDPVELIPKKQLINDLGKEASDFLAAILAVELPPSGDRLNIPVIETGEKRNAAAANRTYLEIFLEENCHHVTGKIIKFGELYERFQEWIDADELRNWSKKRVGRELPTHFPKGRSRADNQVIVGNISWTAKKPDEPILPKLALVGDHLEVVL